MLPVLFRKLGSQSGQRNVIQLQTGPSKDNSSFNFFITVFSVSTQANEPITLAISTWTASPQERSPGRTSEIKWNENEPREHSKRGNCFRAAIFVSLAVSFFWKKNQTITRLQVTNESPQTRAEIALCSWTFLSTSVNWMRYFTKKVTLKNIALFFLMFSQWYVQNLFSITWCIRETIYIMPCFPHIWLVFRLSKQSTYITWWYLPIYHDFCHQVL